MSASGGARVFPAHFREPLPQMEVFPLPQSFEEGIHSWKGEGIVYLGDCNVAGFRFILSEILILVWRGAEGGRASGSR